MNHREFFLPDYVRCFYCARCIEHNRKQHNELLARWCDTHQRWCNGHKRQTANTDVANSVSMPAE